MKINDHKTELPSRRKFLASVGALLLAAQIDSAAADEQGRPGGAEATKLDFLKKYPTSLLESAVYLLRESHGEVVTTLPGLKMQTPDGETAVGYAVTSVYSTDPDDARGRRENLDYWNYVFNQPGPKIAVSVDGGKNPGSGSSWGQQNAYIHHGLGCRAVLTNGGVRDIAVFREMNFQVFSGSLTAAHGNPHFIDFGKPVTISGALVNPGDIVCADEHGAIVIPPELMPNIEAAAAENQRRVKLVAGYCQTKNFTPQGLAEVIKSLKPATPWKPK